MVEISDDSMELKKTEKEDDESWGKWQPDTANEDQGHEEGKAEEEEEWQGNEGEEEWPQDPAVGGKEEDGKEEEEEEEEWPEDEAVEAKAEEEWPQDESVEGKAEEERPEDEAVEGKAEEEEEEWPQHKAEGNEPQEGKEEEKEQEWPKEGPKHPWHQPTQGLEEPWSAGKTEDWKKGGSASASEWQGWEKGWKAGKNEDWKKGENEDWKNEKDAEWEWQPSDWKAWGWKEDWPEEETKGKSAEEERLKAFWARYKIDKDSWLQVECDCALQLLVPL